jgi:TRAP-type C4-dicarboxylate transport system permease small subunit
MIPRVLNGLYWAEAILAVTAFSGVALALSADVIGRELFGDGIYGAQKFAVYCTAVAGMTGFALVVAKGGHLRPKFFDRLVPQRYDALANRLADLTAAAICIFLGIYALQFVISSYELQERGLGLNILVWPIQSIIPYVLFSSALRYFLFALLPANRPAEEGFDP